MARRELAPAPVPAIAPTLPAGTPGRVLANPFTATSTIVLVVALREAGLASRLTALLQGLPGIDAVYSLTELPASVLACPLVMITDAPGLKPFNSANGAFSQPVIAVGQSNAHAMAAFDHGACGFIQVPLCAEQVRATIAHAVAMLNAQARQRRIGQAISQLARQMQILPGQIHHWLNSRTPAKSGGHRITLRSENAWCTIECGAIRWVQAAGDYMCIYTAQENFVVRITLNELCKKLCPHYFKKVNRSVLVNRRFVKTVQHAKGQTVYAVLNDDTRLRISRKYFTAHWQQAIGPGPDQAGRPTDGAVP